jgi:hypothetical protein
MRSGVFVPLFDELAEPARVAALAAEAEEAGWDGFFVWDHVRWREPVVDVADTQITLAAIAASTEQLAEIVGELTALRPDAETEHEDAYDIVVRLRPGTDPGPYAAAGATWWLVAFPWDRVSEEWVRGVIREGPAPGPSKSADR